MPGLLQTARLRPRLLRRRQPARRGRGDRAAGRPATAAPGTAGPRAAAPAVGRDGRDRAAPAGRRPRGDARPDRPPDRAQRRCPTYAADDAVRRGPHPAMYGPVPHLPVPGGRTPGHRLPQRAWSAAIYLDKARRRAGCPGGPGPDGRAGDARPREPRPSSARSARRSDVHAPPHTQRHAGPGPGRHGWHKPWSGDNGGSCVEAKRLGDGRVALRQSTDPDGPALIFTPRRSPASSGLQAGRRTSCYDRPAARRAEPSPQRPRRLQHARR